MPHLEGITRCRHIMNPYHSGPTLYRCKHCRETARQPFAHITSSQTPNKRLPRQPDQHWPNPSKGRERTQQGEIMVK